MYEEGQQRFWKPCQTVSTSCHSSCKCHVEIVSTSDSIAGADDSGFISDFHRRSTIRIRDCDCAIERKESNNNNDSKLKDAEPIRTAKENLPMIVANPGYMMAISMLNTKHTTGRPAVTKAPFNLPPVIEAKAEHIAIASQDLMSFANQIASGMVSTSYYKCYFGTYI